MKTQSLFTPSRIATSRIHRAIKVFLIASILVGLTLVWVPSAQALSYKSANKLSIMQPYEVALLTDLFEHSSRLIPHDFEWMGYLYNAAAKSHAYWIPFEYTIPGHLVTRYLELWPNIRYTNEPILENLLGQNIASEDSVSDLSTKPCNQNPRITYTIAGYTMYRHTELGPLGNPAGSSIQECGSGEKTNLVVNVSDRNMIMTSPQPLITYYIAGQEFTRRSDLGPLTGYGDNSFSATTSAKLINPTDARFDPGVSLCGSLPTIMYTIAGYTIHRHSDLGPLAVPTGYSLQDCLH